jgi:outer membrane receptor protein involved in Fe transport
MRITLILSLFLFFSGVLLGQNTVKNKGRITGKVVDEATKVPVDYATISVFKQGSASPFNGISSDPKGNFSVDNLPPGEYQITVEFLGYQRKVVDHLVISAANPVVALGNISLTPVQRQLKGVTITAKAPVVENKIDKMVYNAANDLTAQGGVALDVLKKVPMVTVDIDGNVELQGDANIRFLINGKPSSIFGASLADALQSIPASQIKSIEVITSPGAKYDATGTGGIINIILKDSKPQGVNGSVNLSAGTLLDNGSFNLNARKGNVGVNAFFSGNERLSSTTITTANRTSNNAANDTLTDLYQKGTSTLKRSGYQSGMNFNWSITKKDELSASIGYNHFGNSNAGLTTQDQQTNYTATNATTDLSSLRNSVSRFNANSLDWSLGYKKTFKKEDQELDVLYNSSNGQNTFYSSQVQDYLSGAYPASGAISNSPGTDNETDISIDYTQPLAKGFTLETGAKTVIENLTTNIITDSLLNNGGYGPNANQTYGFVYKRSTYAAYLSGSFVLFNDFINGKAGLRYENTTTHADFQGISLPGYHIFAPSFVLQHKLDKTQSIKFSFSYRIEPPDYGALNPFYNISDPHNISTGNPYLRPEKGHNFELGYNRSFDKGGNIAFSAYYRYNTDDLQSLTTFYSVYTINGVVYPDVSLTRQINQGSQYGFGVNLFGSVPVTEQLSLRSNIQAGERTNSTIGYPLVTGYGLRANLNASYQFKNNLMAEVFGNYNSSQKILQGTRPSFAFYNFAIRKQFNDKKASIGLTAANPFNRYVNQSSNAYGPNFYQSNVRQTPFRSFGISLNYKFGKLEFKKDEKEENNNPPVPSEN